MVKSFIKYLFLNYIDLDQKVRLVNFLPEALQNQYADYYRIGSGFRVFLLCLLLFVVTAIIAESNVVRRWAKVMIVFIFLFTPSGEVHHFRSHIVSLNLLDLPLVLIPMTLQVIILFASVLFIYAHYRKQISAFIQKRYLLTCDVLIFILILIFYLPFISGEV